MLGSVVEFTTPVRAGLLMGVRDVANMLGRAAGSLLGGIVVDTMRLATGSALAADTALFVFEVAMLVGALALTFRLNPAAPPPEPANSARCHVPPARPTAASGPGPPPEPRTHHLDSAVRNEPQ